VPSGKKVFVSKTPFVIRKLLISPSTKNAETFSPPMICLMGLPFLSKVVYAISDLFRREILVNKKSTGEQHCSLDSRKLKKIDEIENS